MKTESFRRDGLFLSERFFVCLAFIQLIGIAAIAFPGFAGVYLLLSVVFGATLVIDLGQVSPRLIVSGRLELPDVIQLRKEEKVRVSIETRRIPALAKFYAEFPRSDLLSLSRPKVELRENQGIFRVTGRILGRAEFNRFYATIHSPFGFWVRGKFVTMNPVRVSVQPIQRDVSEQEFNEIARRNFLFLGTKVRARGSAADQYLTTRKFQFTDSLRHLDHKKTAKFSTLMTKSFEELRQHRLIIALDLGRAMSGEISASNKHNFYLSAALALAKHGVRSGDTVDFFAFSRKLHLMLSGVRSLAPFHRVLEQAEGLRPQDVESDYSILQTVTTRLSGQRAIVILLSDLSRPGVQTNLIRSIAPICRKHLFVAAGVIDRRYDLDTQILGTNAIDTDAAARLVYCYWLQEQGELFHRSISGLGGGALAVSEDDWLGVIEKLYVKMRESNRS